MINRNDFYVMVDGVRRLGNDDEWEQMQILREQYVEHSKLEIRTLRNALLKDSDWVVHRSTETGTPVPSEWATYRQALRDIPLQSSFPQTVEWPVKPE